VFENVELRTHVGTGEVDRLDLESAPLEGLAGWMRENVVYVADIAAARSFKESNLAQNQRRAGAQHNLSHPPEDLPAFEESVRASCAERSGRRHPYGTARGDPRVLAQGADPALLGAIRPLSGDGPGIEGVATRSERTLDGGCLSSGFLREGLALVSSQGGEQPAEPFADTIAAALLCQSRHDLATLCGHLKRQS